MDIDNLGDIIPSFGENRVVIPKATKKQAKLKVKPEYYGLKINECELEKHDTTVLDIIAKFKFTTWVVGRDEALGKKAIPHYHIHFKSSKNIEALRKQKQDVMPNWGRSTKLGPPRAEYDNWPCWAGYATKEQIIGMSPDITDEDKIEIAKHAHTQATVKRSKLNWSNKQDEKKQEKKDLETRLYEILDAKYLGKSGVEGLDVCSTFGEEYFKEVGEMPSGSHVKSKVFKWLYTRKIISMYDYMNTVTDFRNFVYNS